MVSTFTTWALTKVNELTDKELRHKNSALVYLDQTTNELPQIVIMYINYWWPTAFRSTSVQRKIGIIVRAYCQQHDEHAICTMYESVVVEENHLKTVFRTVPVLFFKYNELFNKYSPTFSMLYGALNAEQQKFYAEKAFNVNGYLIRQLSLEDRTQESYDTAVRTSPGVIRYTPKVNRTAGMIEAAVRKSAYVLEYLTIQQQDLFLEKAVLNPGNDDTNWPSDLWNKIYNKIDGRVVFIRVGSSRRWLQTILNRTNRQKLIELYRKWEQKKNDMANRWHNEHAPR